ncbi:MAG: YjjG family noncanonical pyrimidine nucleotidase [Prevotella sp.]|jgi:putative hydrolase of the HAD superfamily|nr:YjjG family noncanonical pyrimidine nucleotidase [Prevotella sp.]
MDLKYTDILLDLDDTLIDTVENTRLTLVELYDEYHFSNYFPSFDDFYTIYYVNVSRLWELYGRGQITKAMLHRERFIAPLNAVEEISDEQALAINDEFIKRVMKKGTLIAGAKELLDYLKSRYSLHILSNGFTEMQHVKIESAGLTGYFDKIILSDEVGVNKPHPDLFSFALKKIGADRDRIIMIGDNLFTDIGGAYNSGIDQIWYNPGHKPIQDFRPTYVVDKLSGIEGIL